MHMVDNLHDFALIRTDKVNWGFWKYRNPPQEVIINSLNKWHLFVQPKWTECHLLAEWKKQRKKTHSKVDDILVKFSFEFDKIEEWRDEINEMCSKQLTMQNGHALSQT